MLRGVVSRENEVAPLTRGMSSATWLQVPIEEVFITQLYACQDGVLFEALINPRTPIGGDRYPHIVAHGGRLLIEDGHHRVTRAALAGERMIEARVLRPGD